MKIMQKIVFLTCALLLVGVYGQRKPRLQANAQVEPPSSPSVSAGASAKASGRPIVEILSQEQDILPDGSYKYSYESSDGSKVEESGMLKNPGTDEEALEVQGSATWTDPNGEPINLSWKADENGVVFEGEHLPTPPPTQAIPEAIQRALDWIAKNPSPESTGEVNAKAK